MKSAIVLAAGKGTRMKSTLCKVMHPVANKPMIGHIVSALKAADVNHIIVVVGHGAEDVKEYLKDEVRHKCRSLVQDMRLCRQVHWKDWMVIPLC